MINECLCRCPDLTVGVVGDDVYRKLKGHSPAVSDLYRALLIGELYPEVDIKVFYKTKTDADVANFVKGFDVVFVTSEKRDKPLIFVPDDFAGKIVYISYTKGISSGMIRRNILFGE